PEEISKAEKNETAHSESFSDKMSTFGQCFLGQEIFPNHPKDMPQNDLFIAEFVVVMDSDESEDDVMHKNNQTLSFEEESYKISRAPLQAAEEPGATLPEVNVNEIHIPEAHESEFLRDVNLEEKELQLHSTIPSAAPIEYKPKLAALRCGNERLNNKKPLIHCISEEQEYIFISAPCNIYDEIPLKGKTSMYNNTGLSESINFLSTARVNTDNNLMKTSNLQNMVEIQEPVSEKGSITSHGREQTLSSFPIKIIRHPLCSSPSPLHSPFYGSSSTICSLSESCNPISPAPSCEVFSPASSRLSLLTSLLKFNRPFHGSQQSLHLSQRYLASQQENTCPFLQKSVLQSTIPRKSFSCFSLNSKQEPEARDFYRQAKATPSISESNILQVDCSFYQKPLNFSASDMTHTTIWKSPITDKFTPSDCKENIPPYILKPPLNKSSNIRKQTKGEILSPSLHLNMAHSTPNLTHQGQTIHQLQKYTLFVDKEMPASYTSPNNSIVQSSEAAYLPNSTSLPLNTVEKLNVSQSMTSHILPNHKLFSNALPLKETARKYEPIYTSPVSLSRSSEFLSLSQCSQNEKLYRIKPNYKVFAAVPTNTLLLDQKALDEPQTNEAIAALDEKMETHCEMYSPAQLRQQTEEICAVIDEVLHDPLPLVIVIK
ncbi:hypothetical protein GDO86_009900, partial [Hymenochirus boettgeri]